MAQQFTPLESGVTTFGELYGKVNNMTEALRSAFSGTAYPTAPVEGQLCYRTDSDKLYIYRNAAWEEIPLSGTLWQEIVNARGSKPSLDERLDMVMNEDGTLKAATTLNPSQWAKPALTFTYVSPTTFKVNGDQTDIYKATRRLKVNLSGSYVISEVVSATYAAPDTTIEIADAVLTADLVDVEHSLFLPTVDGGAMSLGMLGYYREVIEKTDSPSTSATTYQTIYTEVYTPKKIGSSIVVTIDGVAALSKVASHIGGAVQITNSIDLSERHKSLWLNTTGLTYCHLTYPFSVSLPIILSNLDPITFYFKLKAATHNNSFVSTGITLNDETTYTRITIEETA